VEDSLDRKTRDLIFLGAAAATYLALGISIWTLPASTADKLLAESLYVLAALNSAVIVLYLRTQKRLYHVETKLRQNEVETGLQEYRADLAEGLVGFVLALSEEPRHDIHHHFTYIEEVYVMHGDDCTFNWLLEGENESDMTSKQIVFKITGDSEVDFESLDASAIDELHNSELKIGLLRDDPLLKVLSIMFGKPLEPKDKFRVRFSCRWSNSFPRTREIDYVFFLWGVYAQRGIARFTGRIVSDVPLWDFVLDRLDGSKRRRAERQPREVEASRGRTVLEWKQESPQQAYLLRFRKSQR
jgi:hypothetical protein